MSTNTDTKAKATTTKAKATKATKATKPTGVRIDGLPSLTAISGAKDTASLATFYGTITEVESVVTARNTDRTIAVLRAVGAIAYRAAEVTAETPTETGPTVTEQIAAFRTATETTIKDRSDASVRQACEIHTVMVDHADAVAEWRKAMGDDAVAASDPAGAYAGDTASAFTAYCAAIRADRIGADGTVYDTKAKTVTKAKAKADRHATAETNATNAKDAAAKILKNGTKVGTIKATKVQALSADERATLRTILDLLDEQAKAKAKA